MVHQTIDSNISENVAGRPETDLPSGDEEVPVASRKQTALNDLQNNQSVAVPDSIGTSPLSKDKEPVTNSIKLAGTKRTSPECPESPSRNRSPNNNNNTNGQLVYVRRKSEAELSKSTARDSTNINTSSLNSKPINQQPATTQLVPPIKEPKVTCFPAFAPFPMTSSAIPSGKPSVPPPLGKSCVKLPSAEPNHHPLAFATASAGNLETLRNLHWEARYTRLQSLLRKLDHREQENYIRLLRSLTSVELSGHAVELEKRSIQLSLDEAKELQRAEAMNVLGKPLKSAVSPPSNLQDEQEK